ncbi:hypothetical protein GO730_05870 [Spirosoma sp. HMF3257]|uniref:Uncharacterized protein n=1 Tax=Spirosoma telluris TaxID=2183553 RepID=A0A327NGS7_9BACT|nr:hypothetical protein [Spirosoma telluris]RAI74003.1 hypothetical protein HMF3257_05825 [Spirosoma telluris]
MKLTKFLMATVILFAGALTIAATDNALACLVAMPVTSYAFQRVTGFRLFDSHGLALATLAAIPRTHNRP